MTTEERNKLDKENIDLMKNYLEKLTGSSRFQGDVGEKILQNILQNQFYIVICIYFCVVLIWMCFVFIMA